MGLARSREGGEGLVDQAVRHPWVVVQPRGQPDVAGRERAGTFAQQDACSDAAFTPARVHCPCDPPPLFLRLNHDAGIWGMNAETVNLAVERGFPAIPVETRQVLPLEHLEEAKFTEATYLEAPEWPD